MPNTESDPSHNPNTRLPPSRVSHRREYHRPEHIAYCLSLTAHCIESLGFARKSRPATCCLLPATCLLSLHLCLTLSFPLTIPSQTAYTLPAPRAKMSPHAALVSAQSSAAENFSLRQYSLPSTIPRSPSVQKISPPTACAPLPSNSRVRPVQISPLCSPNQKSSGPQSAREIPQSRPASNSVCQDGPHAQSPHTGQAPPTPMLVRFARTKSHN